MKPSDYIIHLTISIFLIVGVYQFYFWCQRHYLTEPKRLNLPLDDRIPYWPSWVWIYSFLYYPLILYTNLIVRSPGHFTHLAISYLVLLGFQMPFFLLFPVAFVQGFDASSNSFPSMHTSVATLTALHLYPSLGVASWSFPVLIGLSCLFTKQHYLIDLPAGAALGWLVFYIFRMTG